MHAPGRAFSRGVLCVPMRCLTCTVGSGVDSREAQVMTARVVVLRTRVPSALQPRRARNAREGVYTCTTRIQNFSPARPPV